MKGVFILSQGPEKMRCRHLFVCTQICDVAETVQHGRGVDERSWAHFYTSRSTGLILQMQSDEIIVTQIYLN